MTKLTVIPGVGPVTARKLQEAGVEDAEAVAAATVELLVQLTGFYQARAEAIRRAASELSAESAPQARLPITDEAPETLSPEPEAPAKPERSKKRRKKAKKHAKLAKKLRKKAKKLKAAGKNKKAKKARKAAKKARKKAKKFEA